MSRVLVIRLSALGDVAMLVPVLYSVAVQYPEDEFILVTKKPLLGIFTLKPSNVSVFPVDTKGRHRGFKGLWTLIRELAALKPDAVADAHKVTRSLYIRLFFHALGKKSAVIDKGKPEKQAMTRKKNKKLVRLKTSFQRYGDVFSQLGYSHTLTFDTIFDFGERNFSEIRGLAGEKNGTWVGIAPFAKHRGKIYPLEKTEEIVISLDNRPDTTIFLFGSKEESELLKSWESRYPHAICVAGNLSFTTELLLMSYLDVMLTMDSGNMHLASLVRTPVVSVWGATHPYAGFYGYRQDPENAVQSDLFCRPCSVFGDKPCYRKDYACLNGLPVEMVMARIDKVLNK